MPLPLSLPQSVWTALYSLQNLILILDPDLDFKIDWLIVYFVNIIWLQVILHNFIFIPLELQTHGATDLMNTITAQECFFLQSHEDRDIVHKTEVVVLIDKFRTISSLIWFFYWTREVYELCFNFLYVM